MQTDFSLQKAFPLVKTEQVLVVEMEVGRNLTSTDLVSWAIVNDKGERMKHFTAGPFLMRKTKMVVLRQIRCLPYME